MITKSILKEIIVINEEFIDRNIISIVPRVYIPPPESLNKVVIFYGVRRSGKTFILYDFFKRYRDRALYIDFEDERLAGFQLKDFELLRSSFLELKPELIGKETVFLLDEIQHVPGWEKFCRRAIERENVKVFLSGSASKMMPFEIHTALRGRAWSMEVLPFSFKEYLGARGMKDILQSMLVFEVRKYAESTYKRMRNPAKIYAVDTGLCRRVSSNDTGRLLENAVFLELKRRGLEIFYYEGGRECDYVTRSPNNQWMAMQVFFELNEQNTEREMGGLAEACEILGIKEGVVITNDEERELKADGIKVYITPAWKWMIS